MEDKITLDRESFKALAADTRVRILKFLYKRRHMQAELATSLGMSEPAVKQHLTAMKKAGLVVRKDEGRKWKYYELTNKGKAILDPEQKRIWIVLAIFVLSVVGGVTGYIRTLLGPLYAGTATQVSTAESALSVKPAETIAVSASAPAANDAAEVLAVAEPATGIPIGIILIVIWLLILLAIMGYSMYKRKKYLGKSLTNK